MVHVVQETSDAVHKVTGGTAVLTLPSFVLTLSKDWVKWKSRSLLLVVSVNTRLFDNYAQMEIWTSDASDSGQFMIGWQIH